MQKIAVLLLLAAAITLLAVPPALAGNGNGAPNGQHFTLNIIGVTNPKTTNMTDSQRHTIFVPLTGKCTIGLTRASARTLPYSTQDFAVLDGNCFNPGKLVSEDGTTTMTFPYYAGFQLPAPDPALTGTLQYTVFAKVTSPKGSANMTTCFYDPDTVTGGTYCSTGMTLNLTKANFPKFVNVSKNLLTVCAPIAFDPTTGAPTAFALKPLFASTSNLYWWEYDNQGLRHAQFRFYPKVPDNSPYAGTQCTAK